MTRPARSLTGLWLVVVLIVALAEGNAGATERRVGFVNGTAVLDRAIAVALAAWELAVVHVDATSPGHEMPHAVIQAKAIADANKVSAVAWISGEGADSALWLYDAATGQTVSRQVESLSLSDEAATAAIALSLKTLLRASTVAPVTERIGGREEQRMRSSGLFRLEADGAARFLASDQTLFDPRLGLAVAWWPRPFARRFGLTLRGEAGTGIAEGNERFTGRLTDVSAAPALRFRFPLLRWLALETTLGGAVRVTTIDGAAPLRGVAVHATRIDPSIDAGLLLSIEVAWGVEIALRAGGAHLLRYQRYLVGGESILELSPWQLEGGLVLGAPLN